MSLRISVVIPTYNRVRYLERLAGALEEQTIDKTMFEVIFVDDGSKDSTAAYLEEAKKSKKIDLQYFNQANKGPAAARNLGIKHAKGEYVAFTDDDCVPEKDWLESLMGLMPNDKTCAGIGGPIKRTADDLISFYMDDEGILAHLKENEKILYLVTANAFYKRSCLLEVEGFNEKISWPGGEDTDISFRIIQKGYYLVSSCEKGAVKHYHRNTLKGFLRTFWIYGYGHFAGVKLATRYTPNATSSINNLLKRINGAMVDARLSLKRKMGMSLLHVLRFAAYSSGYLWAVFKKDKYNV